jgi:NADH dehydrogenase
VDGARQMKDRIEYMFARYHSDEAKEEDLTFVVAGAGFTGMEFMGELSERVPKLCKEYDVPRNKVKMYVIEAMPTALPGFDPELVEYAMNLLENRGVEFKLDSPIKAVTENSVELNTGESVKTSTVIWATGVRGNPLIEESGFENNRARVKVDDDLRAPGHEREFIIGDCSLIINTEIDRPFPPTAQIALQQGETAADNIKALMEGRPTEAFVADIKGTVASLGGKEAIGVVGSKKLYGRPAYFMKKVIENRALWVLGGFGFLLRKGQSPF